MKTKPADDQRVSTSSPNDVSAAPKKLGKGVVSDMKAIGESEGY
jgi:hypothetical protein